MGRAPAESGGTGWRLRRWPNNPTIGLLILVDHALVPTGDELAKATAAARRIGVERLRTSALFPRAAEIAHTAGFVPVDRLSLLRLTLDQHFDLELDALLGLHRPETRPLRGWHTRSAAELDQQAFGGEWGNDTESLAEIRTATPGHRARGIWRRRQLVGFAISGTGGDNGYIQRVAVADDARRQGIGRDLVVDALLWMRRRKITTTFVNTGTANEAALALYRQLGFELLDEQLTIAELRLDSGSTES